MRAAFATRRRPPAGDAHEGDRIRARHSHADVVGHLLAVVALDAAEVLDREGEHARDWIAGDVAADGAIADIQTPSELGLIQTELAHRLFELLAGHRCDTAT
jgi:hypothetical protein